MKTIQSFEIQNPKLGQILTLTIPVNSIILSAEVVGNSLVIYAFIPDDTSITTTRYFSLYVIGQELPADEGTYLFTIHAYKATWFLYEVSAPVTNFLLKDDAVSISLKDDATSKLLKE